MNDKDENIRRVKLAVEKLVFLMILTPGLVADTNINVDVFRDDMQDELVARLTMRLPTEDLRRIVCEWPADWWQAFKERWFPKWITGLFPVRYNHEEIVARAVYPLVSCRGLQHVIMLDGGKEEEP